MTGMITKAQALKLLRERTGHKFTMQVFSKNFCRGKIWCPTTHAFVTSIEQFIARRQARLAEPAEKKLARRIDNVVYAFCKLDKTLQALIKTAGDSPSHGLLETRSWLSYAMGQVLAAKRSLVAAAEAQPGVTVPASPELPNTESR